MAYTVDETRKITTDQSQRQESKKTESLIERLKRQKTEKQKLIDSL